MAADSTLRTFLICVVLLTATPPVWPQETQDEQRLFFDSVNVDVINVEVVVTDQHGQPMAGLTREDFEIYEDGRKAELTHFDEIRSSSEGHLPDEAPPIAEAAPTTAPAEALRNRRLVILIDNQNIASPQSRKVLFTQLREYLRESSIAAAQGESRQAMLALLDQKVEIILPFTDDRELLLTALDAVEQQDSSHAVLDTADRRMFATRIQRATLRGYNPPRAVVDNNTVDGDGDPDFNDAVRVALDLAQSVRTLGEQRYLKAKATVEALSRFCDALGGMPDRKALIYLSDGFPIRPADSLAEAWTDKFQNWALQNSGDIRDHSVYPNADQAFQQVINSLDSAELDLRRNLHRLTVNASRQRVAFYPISTSGRSSERLSATPLQSSGPGSMLRQAQQVDSLTRDGSLLQMAEGTGGLALIHGVNFGELLDRVDHDFANLYTLGYRPPPPEEEDEVAGESTAGETDSSSEKKAGKTGTVDTDKAASNLKETDEKKAAGYAQFRKVNIRVKREGALVRHGKGYYSRSWRQRLGAMTLASALFEVESNPLGVELEPGDMVREGDRFRVPILLTVPFDQIQLVYQGDQYIAQLTAVVVVRSVGDGDISKPQRIDFPIKISGRRILEAAQQSAGYVLEIDVDQGPKHIAVGLRDHFARTEATVNLGITVGEGTS